MKTTISLILTTLFLLYSGLFAQDGYRDIPWGSSKNATRKIAREYFGDNYYETESKLIFTDTFQGNDAIYSFFFSKDSLHTVGIKSELPYLLTDEKTFSDMFDKSEKEVDKLIRRISGKYGQPILQEKVKTDLFLRWEVDDTEIELFVERSYKYKMIMTYRWISYFETKQEKRQQQYLNEL
ncbi:TPA: hypothetical protein DCG86_01305 [Candidatus Marinimicrobia bacterium]|nr:MAG: hypothetical protein XE04_1185 [Marinimicrobia bacterium 46_43]HAE86640.1 hypothetical protein [Candidatus Neomarinimicrobiota bacterium]HBY19104.1 hypothetical protein [Candidatus Neomarinimicrobiota bacterium]